MKSFTFLITLLFLHTSCSDPKIDQDAESQKLMELSRQWAKDVQTDDNEAVLNYWAEDALVMIPGLPRFRGHDAIRKMLDDTSEMPGFEINWEPTEAFVSESGDLEYVIANNYLKSVDSVGNTHTEFNKAVEIWKKQEDGSWKNVVDINNSDPTITSIR